MSPRVSTDDATSSSGRNLIAVIGIDRYRGWPKLTNAVHDARGAVSVFQRLGFESLTTPLLDAAATGSAIHALVTDDLMVLEPDDSLVLFYAGHGATRTQHVETHVVKTGYLVPVDASDRASTWIEINSWLHAVSRLPARHILVILDACHTGIALDPVVRWRSPATWQDVPLSTLSTRRSRRIITSALESQRALDSGPVHGHSLFMGCLIDGLTHDLGRVGGNRFTTGSELAMYIQRRVSTYPNSQQTPDFGVFELDDRGEMIIPLAIGGSREQETSTRPKTGAKRREKHSRVRDARESRRESPSEVERSARTTSATHTILFLAANPIRTDPRALAQEVRAIQMELERSGHRDCFKFEICLAATPLDLLREIRRLKPTVVHFSGYSGQDRGSEIRPDPLLHQDVGSTLDADTNERQHGLYFEGPDGRPHFVPTQALDDLFDAAGKSVKLVVLNACYSDIQAAALASRVDCVVGMGGTIRGDAARNFAIGFYGGLGECESIAAAYKQGRVAVSLERLSDGDSPRLKVREGVDASQLILATSSRRGVRSAKPDDNSD